MLNREHKSRLFARIFGQKEHDQWTLDLYNAINDSHYDNPADIMITTMEDVIYMGMQNDVSFLVADVMSIYEQQSSFNPNMPIRQLMYSGRLYHKYIQENDLNIYGERQVPLPVPKLVTFYNGTKEKEDEVILQLKDAFRDNLESEKSDICVRVRMININYDRNRKIMKQCKPLQEYAWFIDRIRENYKTMDTEEAIGKAIDAMPEYFGIKKMLVANRGEIMMDLLTEYDAEKVNGWFYRDGKEEGKAEGKAEGREIHLINQVCKKLKRGLSVERIAEDLEEETRHIQAICDVATFFAPDYDTDAIYQKLHDAKAESAMA